jgi:hypothetical protein
MYLKDNDGRIVDSEFSLDVESGAHCVVVESSGGSNPSNGVKRRNPEYNRLLNILLQRLRDAGALISAIVLDSKPVEGLPIEERVAKLDSEYPIDLVGLDLNAFRKMFGRRIANMHRSPTAKAGGNAQKKIRICLDRMISPNSLLVSQESLDPPIDDHAPGVGQTEREYLSKARIGQGGFRKDLLNAFRSTCPCTGIQNLNLLVASHIKPWKACTNKERLDPNNGILFSALMDRLFDQGLITFGIDGCVIAAPQLSKEDQSKCRLKDLQCLSLTQVGQQYMKYHRSVVFKGNE